MVNNTLINLKLLPQPVTFNQLDDILRDLVRAIESSDNKIVVSFHKSRPNDYIAAFFIDSQQNVANLLIDYHEFVLNSNSFSSNCTFGPYCYFSANQVNGCQGTNGIQTAALHIRENFDESTNVGGTLTFYPPQSGTGSYPPQCPPQSGTGSYPPGNGTNGTNGWYCSPQHPPKCSPQHPPKCSPQHPPKCSPNYPNTKCSPNYPNTRCSNSKPRYPPCGYKQVCKCSTY